ncbi:hypothetical protein SUDANB171_04912 [Streptomyces sp. enrichment culture]|uniref:hypothetical protein n=1 Tax=Streptomyces sp. enrichment culture TaxID=1795815 RepID=UPI003F579CEC
MNLTPLLHALHQAENALAQHLLEVAGRHRAEHEVHHVARDLAGWSRRHAEALAEATGSGPDGHPRRAPGDCHPNPVLEAEAGLRLLRDLRQLHLHAAAVSVDWELLAQAAQARRRPELLRLAQQCHPDTLRQLRWANAQLKVLSPQLLTATA